ncbi:MAG: LrgB family protein [Sarcina sp.]
MHDIVRQPLFSMLICIIGFELGILINKKTRIALFNPLLIGILFVIGFLLVFHIQYNQFNKGAQFINDLLEPATVALAVPLYKQMRLLKKHAIPIITGMVSATFVGLIFIFFSSYALGLNKSLIESLMPKSITTPIGVQVTKTLGGIVPITVVAIIITGITGAVISTFVFKLFRIKNDIAKGVAYGTSCHAMGTSKALETNEIQGGISSLSMGLNGLLVVFLAPPVYHILASLVHLH